MERTLKNKDLREVAKAAGVRHWEIAELWGVSEMYISRMLRHELTKSERARFLQAVEEISKREQA